MFECFKMGNKYETQHELSRERLDSNLSGLYLNMEGASPIGMA